MDKFEFALSRPLTSGDGSKILKVTLREPTVGDMIKAEKFSGRIAYTTALIASITEIPIPVLETMRPGDFDQIDRKLGDLMGNSLGTDG